MKTMVQKWGNSLAVRLPKAMALDAGLTQGTSLELSHKDGCLVLKPLKQKTLRLDDLVAGVTKQNLHRDVSTGKRSGTEEW